MVTSAVDGAPAVEAEVPPRDPSRVARRLGTVGTLLMGIGAFGAGALPSPNPLFGVRILGLPARNVTIAIAITYTGLLLLVMCWLWIGKMLRENGAVAPAPDGVQLWKTAILWAVPLALAPPLFSRDVYSYLAQSATLARGLDPYTLPPVTALGIDDPLVRSIPNIWRDTGAPYGPLFLVLGRGITAISGNDLVLGIFCYRVLALAGLAMIIWALPKLAKRCNLDAGLVLWLGAANPIVLFHLISGMHNEALMVGLMLVGMEIGLRATERITDPMLLGGALLIVCASAVKLPAALALGFLGMDWARKRGNRIRDVALAAGLLLAVALIVYVPLSAGLGVGIGWATTLAIPSLILSWMSVTTDLGMIGGQVGIIAGFGEHTQGVLTVTRAIGLLLGAAAVAWVLWLTYRGRVDAFTGMAAALAAFVLLGPVVHPWYLLWAVIPLAATRAVPGYRRAVLAISAVLAVVVPPTGADFNFRAFQLPLAIVAGVLLLVLVLAVQRRLLIGQRGYDIEMLPGRRRAPAPPETPQPSL
ncbi:polyprenol phosphomannose-dependent alpha 1,6 mannosyltransferase MptB [Pseudonocardia sp. CA-107938]|uniref:polyprenol phosphomannose-dependent alpha 1,6 mannosyltransferase MptB n=1 Tax=Pseudonocardia sp. CA-107938 TaxID=3240021 RepID=UPI003D8B200D